MVAHHSRRAGLSINPLVFLLALLLIVVLAWRCWVILDLIAEARAAGAGAGGFGSSTYENAKHTGVVVGTVLVGLFCLAVAGGIGAGAYFVTGRSDGAASAAMCLTLLLVTGWFGYDTYRGLTSPRPTPAETPSARNQRLHEEFLAKAREDDAAMERNRRAAIEQMRIGVVPGGAGSTQPATPNNGHAPDARGASPSPPPPPLPPPLPTAAELEATRKATAALAPLREEISTKVAAFLAAATPLLQSLDKVPRALRSELDAREKACSDLKQKATELEAYFRALDERAGTALKDAGLEFGDQIRQKMAFSRSADAFAKAGACGTYQRFFDAGLSETEALKESAGKWKTDAGGQVTSTDIALQSRLRHLRKGVTLQKSSLAAAESTLKQPPTPEHP